MGSLLKKYSDEMHNKISLTGGKSSDLVFPGEKVKDPLERYKVALEKKESLEISFKATDEDESLIRKDEYGVKIILPGDYLRQDLPYYAETNKQHFIGVDFVVKVVKVDEATSTVVVRSAYHNSQSTRQKIVREILGELGRKDRKEDELLVLPGRIVTVNEKRALVDLLGKGILGIIPAVEWSVGYVRHLPKEIKKGEIYDFVVLKQKQNSGRHRSLAFELTRKPITEDPWELLKKNNPGLAAGSIITVECIGKPAGRSYWWGKSELVDGIEIMGDYSTSIARPYVGVLYKCRIKRFDPDNHKFQVVPFDIIDSPGGSKEAVRFISEKPKKASSGPKGKKKGTDK